MKIRLLIKGDAIQYGENDFRCPCRTIDVNIADNLIDKEHEHIIGVEAEPQGEQWKSDVRIITPLWQIRCDDDCSMYEPQEGNE